jgi:hypothetical protein
MEGTMPVHDWTLVEDGVFHDFHHVWITTIRHALNHGILPADYYAMADQVAGPGNPDVLGLQRSRPVGSRKPARGAGAATTAVLPTVQFQDAAEHRPPVRRRKRVAIRHVTGDRVVALIEIVSPGNKSNRDAIRAFTDKLAEYLDGGIHLLVLDLFPPGRRDPNGIHPLIWSAFKKTAFELPPKKPLTLAAYAGGEVPRAFVQPVAAGDRLPNMPLFLTPDEHVSVPLDTTYEAAWAEVPERWREVLEQPRADG